MTTCSVPNGNEIIRISSGIPGLDPMIEGGFPFPAVIMVAGTAGVGKTTFALKYLSEERPEKSRGLLHDPIGTNAVDAEVCVPVQVHRPRDVQGDKIIYSDLGAMTVTSSQRTSSTSWRRR